MSQGSINVGSGYIKDAFLGSTPIKGIYQGSTLVWPPPIPEVATYLHPGTYTYTLPSWFMVGRDKLDIACIGADGGGGGRGFFGDAGTRGTNGSWATSNGYSPSGNLTLSIGTGGNSAGDWAAGSNGSATTVKYGSTTILTGTAGSGGAAGGSTSKTITVTGTTTGNRVICAHADLEQFGNTQSNNQTLRYFRDAGFLSNPDLLVQDAAGTGGNVTFTSSNSATWDYGCVAIEMLG